MSLYDTIKANRLQARKLKNQLAIDVYCVILYECDSANDTTDSFVLSRINKLIKSNEESLAHKPDNKLQRENELLKEFIPKLTIGDIEKVMDGKALPKNDGKKIGVVCNALKSAGYVPDINLVKEFLNNV